MTPQPATAVTVGGPFTLTAQDGSAVTDQTFIGRWLLVYFGYTSCPDSCPTALVEMVGAIKQLGPDAAKAQAIFITVDPMRDTRTVMRDYVQSFDPPVAGLTGTPDQIDVVMRAYGAYSARREIGSDERDYVMDHSVYIYLMNPRGDFVRAFDTNWSGDRIAAAVRTAMTAARERGSARSAATVSAAPPSGPNP